MASSKEQKDFIKEIAPYAQKAYKEIGKVLPSICIGMACVESAYGTSGIMRAHNAYFGQKVGTGKTAKKYWSGKFFTTKTKEEYTVGTHTVIQAAFRAYDSMEQSVFNYYELLNTSLYDRVKAGVHYSTQMEQIKQCGYMTSSTEVNTVLNLIARYELTRYDTAAGAPKQETLKPTLRKGQRGEYVRDLQLALNKHGYGLKVDGIFGENTRKAVVDFQEHKNLKTDGIVGKMTWSELERG